MKPRRRSKTAWPHTEKTKMTGFILLLVHEMDDVPVGLFYTRQACIESARFRSIDNGLTDHEREVANTDASTPLGFVMVEFHNGRPIRRTVIKWKDE